MIPVQVPFSWKSGTKRIKLAENFEEQQHPAIARVQLHQNVGSAIVMGVNYGTVRPC